MVYINNNLALYGYYCAVLAIMPFVGIPFGVVALILGTRGLKFEKQHPEAKGQGLAWRAINLGGICVVGYSLLLVLCFTVGSIPD